MPQRRRRRMQFVSDALVQEIVDGIKTASVVDLGDVDVADGDYDDPLVVGEFYAVYDSALTVQATIRIVAGMPFPNVCGVVKATSMPKHSRPITWTFSTNLPTISNSSLSTSRT